MALSFSLNMRNRIKIIGILLISQWNFIYDCSSGKRNSADEFTRMYYVACSRAKEDLYVHILDEGLISKLQASIDVYVEKTGKNIAYEFIQ